MRSFGVELHRLGLLDLGTAASLQRALGVEATALAALDPSQGLRAIWMPAGVVTTLPLRSAADAEAALPSRAPFREEPGWGAWAVPRGARAGAPCLLRADSQGPRLICGADEALVRASARWLSAQAAPEGDALRVRVVGDTSASIGPPLRDALGALADWLDDAAASARRQRGRPAVGDPEPIVAQIRSWTNDLVGSLARVREPTAALRLDPEGARVEFEALLPAAPVVGAGSEPLGLLVPRRGVALSWRLADAQAAAAAEVLGRLTVQVLGDRLRDRSTLERSIPRWASLVRGSGALAISFEGERSGALLTLQMRDAAAAQEVALGLRAAAAPRAAASAGPGVTAVARGVTLELRSGEVSLTPARVASGATVVGIARAGDDPAQSATLIARRLEGGRSSLRVFIGAELLRAAVGARGGARDH